MENGFPLCVLFCVVIKKNKKKKRFFIRKSYVIPTDRNYMRNKNAVEKSNMMVRHKCQVVDIQLYHAY